LLYRLAVEILLISLVFGSPVIAIKVFLIRISLAELLMNNQVLNQAQSWGFVCNLSLQGRWQIFPKDQAERWKLQQLEEKWLLTVNDIPQINLLPSEIITFLERRLPSNSVS
jgi:hypothetical protein